MLFSLQLLISFFDIKSYGNDGEYDGREAQRNRIELEFAAIAKHSFDAFADRINTAAKSFRFEYTPHAAESCSHRIAASSCLAATLVLQCDLAFADKLVEVASGSLPRAPSTLLQKFNVTVGLAAQCCNSEVRGTYFLAGQSAVSQSNKEQEVS